MHKLINKEMVDTIRNKEMVDTIRTTGKTSKALPDREEILKEHALPYDREAENAIITGCQILSMLPHILCSLTRILDRKGFSYTFLSQEYCCGNYLYRPAIKARDDEAMAQCRDLGSSRQGCNSAGESPAVPIARFRHVAIPQFMWVTTCSLRGVNGPAALRIVIHSGGSNLGV